MDSDQWSRAVVAATVGMSSAGAGERRRHAAGFAAWCRAHDIEPLAAGRDDVVRHVADTAGGDRSKASKIRCSLRAVVAASDRYLSARMLGLGARTDVLEGLEEPVAELVEATVRMRQRRRAVRLSALRRLVTWTLEVDVPPEELSPVDLAQFRDWLTEVGASTGETMAVARDFVAMSYSGQGLRAQIEPKRPQLRLLLDPPLPRRFGPA